MGGEPDTRPLAPNPATSASTDTRSLVARVECLDHRGEPLAFTAEGWHARIVQHEVDHLHGGLYIDRMLPRTFATVENHNRYWNNRPMAEVLEALQG